MGEKTTRRITVSFPGAGILEITKTYEPSTGEIKTRRKILPPKQLKILKRGGN